MSFLNLKEKKFLVFGVSNKKSVAWHVAKLLEEEGASVVYSVRTPERRESVKIFLKDRPLFVCNVEKQGDVERLAKEVGEKFGPFDGVLHSIAFGNYKDGFRVFHETKREDFLQAVTISSFSLVEIARAFKPYLKNDASIVAISISSQVAAENYGYMSPIKASLESCVRFLAKSFSKESRVRFNTVNAGPLKTVSSAGIPRFLENYLYAEKLTLRKQALKTQEVADLAVYLLSERASGINGQGIVVDAGMGINYFDAEIVETMMKVEVK